MTTLLDARTAARGRPLGRGRFVVVGLGNRLQSDEALGSLVVDELAGALPMEFVGQVEAIDGGTVGLGLLPFLSDVDGLIVVDAIDHDAPPGALIEMEGASLPSMAGPLGVHELGAAELLAALCSQGRLPPRIRILGLQPQTIALGVALSPIVAARVPDLLDLITRCLRDWAGEVGSGSCDDIEP